MNYASFQGAARMCLFALLAMGLWQGAGAQETRQKPARIVTQYALTSDDDYQNNDPKDWQLLASNDEGKTWTLLDKRQDQIFAKRSQRRVFNITNQVAYNIYRLQVDRAYFSAEMVEIAEIELMGPVAGVTNESALDTIVTASLEHPLMGPASQAFDGDINTKWWDYGLGQSNKSWIQCQYALHSDQTVTNIEQLILAARRAAIHNPFPNNASKILSNLTAQTANATRALTGYALTSANDAPTRDPRDWRLLGSKDGGKTWDALDVRRNEIFGARFQRRVFTLDHVTEYSLYRLQIDAVADAAGQFSDSIQLAGIEPLYPAKATDTNGMTYGMIVSAQGEHPPLETIEMAFDNDPNTKWLDFCNDRTNRSSWIQWQYIRNMGGVIVGLNRLRTASHESSRPVKVDIEGVVVLANTSNDLGILDASGCELLRLPASPVGVRFGDWIHLKGSLQFSNQQASVASPELVSLGRVSGFDEIYPGQAMPDTNFLVAAVSGRMDMVSQGSFYSSLELTSANDREHIQAKIPDPEHVGLGNLSGCRLQVRGVVEAAFDQSGQRVAGTVWASGLDQVSLMPLTDQEWSAGPEYAIADLAQPTVPWGTLVRVRGQTGGQNSGHHMVITQGSSQLAVDFHQPPYLPAGTMIECAGLLTKEGSQPLLRLACFRQASGNRVTHAEPAPVIEDADHPITELHQLIDLTTHHPEKTYAVRIRGVITYIDNRLGGFFLQSGPDGIQVDAQSRAGLSAQVRQEGKYVELNGIATGDWFRPVGFVTFLGQGTMPEPRRPSWDEMLTGKDDDGWVEIKGVVTDAGTQLTVIVDGREMKIWVNKMDRNVQKKLLGSLVRIRGVCSGVFNDRNQRLGERLLVSSDENIEVLRTAPENPLDLPAVPVGQLMQSPADYTEQVVQFIKTKGIVTYKDADQFFVQDGDAGVRVIPLQEPTIAAGDLVEVAGLGKADGLSPELIQASVRKVGQAPLPAGRKMDLFGVGSGIQENMDAARVLIDATYLGSSYNGTVQVLEMQHENPKRLFYAYLPAKEDFRLPFDVGSKVRLAGVFKAKTEGALDYGQLTTSCEIFLNSVSDIAVLQRPPWWTAEHTFWILAALAAVLTLVLAWAGMLRKQVRVRTSELSNEIKEHERTEAQLQNEISERKRMQEQVENTHKELMVASRQAGMAEVATNVLHNVGNILNSVFVSATLIGDTIRHTRSGSLSKTVALLREHLPDISSFLTRDPKGKMILNYLDQLAEHWAHQQSTALEEVQNLAKNLRHIEMVVSMQQGYAKASGVIESFRAIDVVEDALQMNAESLNRHQLTIIRDYEPGSWVVNTDRHKVLQVLINLIQNAKQACDDSGGTDKRITLRVAGQPGKVLISVQDNGIGVPPENMQRIYNHGFTTRKNGHGFGLHSSALAAKEMGGALRAESDGAGKGATFTLELPLAQTLPLPAAQN
jgi:signal transduction histidine kinase